MKFFVLLITYITLAKGGVIHDDKHHHHHATSYQSIHMEHFHPVPTYAKKEDMHYLEHPVSQGMTAAKVEVHHGTKHEPGFAVANIQSEIHGHHDGHKFIAAGGGHASYEHDENSGKQLQYEEGEDGDGGYSQEDAGDHYQQQQQQYASHEAADESAGDDASYQHQGSDEGHYAASYEHGHDGEQGDHY